MSRAGTEAARPLLWTAGFVKTCLLYLLIFFAFHLLLSTFAYYIIGLGGDEATAGLAAGLFAVSSVLLRPIMGWVLDNKNRRRALLLGLSGLIVFPLSYAACTGLILAIVLRVMHGMFWSASTTAANVLVCDFIPRERFGEGMGWFGLTSAVSTALAPGLGLLLMTEQGFTVMFAAASGFALAGLLLAFSLNLPPRTSRTEAGIRESLRLSRLFDPIALPASLMALVFLLPYGAITTFIALYAQLRGLLPGGSFFFALALASALARVSCGPLVDRRGEGPVVWLAALTMGASLLLLGLGVNAFTYYIAALLFGVAFGMTPPALQAMALRRAAPDRRGAASSTYLCAFDFGIGIGGALAGCLIEWVGYEKMFLLMGLAVALALALYLCWGRNHPSAFNYQEQA